MNDVWVDRCLQMGRSVIRLKYAADADCAICMSSLKHKHVKILPCSHTFHQMHQPWLNASSHCPYCRYEVAGTHKTKDKRRDMWYRPDDSQSDNDSENRGIYEDEIISHLLAALSTQDCPPRTVYPNRRSFHTERRWNSRCKISTTRTWTRTDDTSVTADILSQLAETVDWAWN